jgi:hypothetical protein
VRSEENAAKNGEAKASPSQQCSSAQVDFGQDFLSKNNVTTLQHPPSSNDLAPSDFSLFPRLRSVFKERRFCDVTDIITNATKS